MKKKYWETIIEKSNEKQTLPFIIGAKKILFPDSGLDTIESLLEEIINENNDQIYSMYHCPDIGEYVIYHNKYKNFLIKGIEVFNPATGNLKLILGINMEILGKNFGEIKLGLTKRYEENLTKEKFTFENRDWVSFTKKHKNTIISLKNI